MKRFLAVMFTVALTVALTAPATADKAEDGKDRAVGRKVVGPELMAVQQALKDKGHDPGKVDGKMGPRTSAMLADYQKAEGLKVTGQLDNETRGKLGL